MRSLCGWLLLGALSLACSSSSQVAPTDAGPSDTPVACPAAGGTCLVGPGNDCATQAPSKDQDCDLGGGPGGGICCLAIFDASSAPACVAAGGTCIFGGAVACGTNPPAGANDCGTGGTCCLLDPAHDAGPDSGG